MTRVSTGKLLVGAFVALSLAALVGGFLIIGSPARQRLLALDRQRVNDLTRISNAVRVHWEDNGSLPASLSVLSNAWARQVTDPGSGQPYRYEVTGDETYKLCAVFALKDDESARQPWESRLATHPAGPYCFDLNAANREPLAGFPALLSQ